MSDNNDIVTTSISINRVLYKAAKAKAAHEFRSFSQHVCHLISMDLREAKKRPDKPRAIEPEPLDLSDSRPSYQDGSDAA
jgi:hypothetical protein